MSMLSSFVNKFAAPVLKGFAAGGPIGAAIGAGTALVMNRPQALPAPASFGGGGGIIDRIMQAGPKITMPFGVSGPGGQQLPGFSQPAGGGQCPRGFHLNKRPLSASKRHGAVAAGSMCVRNRHINPLNAKAITRSLRRVKRARKLVAKLQSFNPVRRITSGGHKPGCGCFRCRKR